MSEEVVPAAALPPKQQSIEHFLHDLKKGNIKHSIDVACETIKLLERIVTNSEWETAKDLMEIIKEVGKKFSEIAVTHTLVINMVKRVLKIIRDEYSAALGKCEFDQQESLQKMLVADEPLDYAKKLDSLRKSIAANLRELMEEFQRSPQDIAVQSEEHVHMDEVIMTFGYSRTVEKFLKKAATKRNCHVFVAEADPYLTGHTLAKNLAESNIQTTLIQDSAVCALMPRVNKVIVGAHGILANGGLKATCGVFNLAAAADHYSVPFIVLAPMYKLSPQFVTSSDQEGFNYMLPPEDLLPFEDDELLQGVEVINPAFDYVPADLITLIISNLGANAPTYYSSLVRELFHPSDDSFHSDDE